MLILVTQSQPLRWHNRQLRSLVNLTVVLNLCVLCVFQKSLPEDGRTRSKYFSALVVLIKNFDLIAVKYVILSRICGSICQYRGRSVEEGAISELYSTIRLCIGPGDWV